MNKKDILVLAEHDGGHLKEVTAKTIGAAAKLPGEITLIVVGSPSAEVLEKASLLGGIKKIIWCDDPAFEYFLAENVAEWVAKLGQEFAYILAPATTFGKNILPRVAALLNVAQISEITDVLSPDTFVRPTYAGNVVETVQSLEPIQVMTVRGTAFQSLAPAPNPCPIEKQTGSYDLKLSRFVSRRTSESKRPELTSARIVVAGGRGLQSGENFKLLEELADILGAAVGATRAAVDAGFVSNDYQVGQTGKVVAPDLYLAIGISGAIQHLAGMKDSKVIVAINKDPNAPIFQIAHYRLIGDLFQVLPELNQALAKLIDKGKSR